jgi:hypothetical protein
MWKFLKHQIELADEGIKILREYAIVYLAMEERTGKTGTAIAICEDCSISKVLVVTKLDAMDGWNEHLTNLQHLCSYTVINYHSVHKAAGKYDLAILDEAHNYISGYPKHSPIWKEVRKIVKGLPIIYISATPKAQGTQLLYGQFALSDWSPWSKFKDFYAWYKHWADRDKEGRFKMKYIGPDREAIDYTKVQHDKAYEDVKHLFITKTRAELGFEQEPEDVIHFITLSDNIKEVYNTILKKKVLEFTSSKNGKDYKLVCDSSMKLRSALHMIEGGGIKMDTKDGRGEYLELGNSEKADYIMKTWGDTEDVVIMYNYIVEEIKLKRMFKKAKVLQAQKYAEGVDLSKHKHLIIYSQGWSTAKHTQRRARQANINREDEIKVHYLLVKNAISHQCYKTVSKNKLNFIDTMFERIEL